MKKIGILLAIFMFVSIAGLARAESSSSENRIKRLEEKLKAMQKELAEIKTQQAEAAKVPVSKKKINALVSKAIEEQKTKMQLVPDWVNNIKIKGDLRYRHEWKDDESKTDDRNRHRIQARVGVYGKVNEEVDVGIRLASGNSSTPTSTNQDLDGAFSSKNIWLDLAYFDYHPAAIKGLRVLGGKVKNPFYRAGGSNLMFDSDVNPEGIGAACKTKPGDNLPVFGTVGGFYIEERSTDADTSLWAMQAGATYNLPSMEKTYVTAGGGYYNVGNIEGQDLGAFAGNKNTNGGYDSDFDIAQAFIEVGLPVNDLPVKVFGDFLVNTAAASSEDTGTLFGASVGKCKNPGSWKFTYNYRDLEADTVIGALAEGTFAGGGTDIKGHTLSADCQLAKNWQFAASYFMAERTRSDITADHNVVLVDLKCKF